MTCTMTDVVVFVDLKNGTKLRREFHDVDPTTVRHAADFLWDSSLVKRVHIAVKGN